MMSALTHVYNRWVRPLGEEKGATAIEYGLMAALIAVVIIGAVTAIGLALTGTFQTIAGSV